MKKVTMKKITTGLLLLAGANLSAITSNMSHRMVCAEPLLYTMIDYSKKQSSAEIAPIFLQMYDPTHTIANLIPTPISGNDLSTLTFNQQGNGDINPTWLNLIANNSLANYNSTVTFNPQLFQAGAILHVYSETEHFFADVRTALLDCTTKISMEEVGGGNGLNAGISNALQAFTQQGWNYGKIGESNNIVGLDDIQVMIGGMGAVSGETFDVYLSGFGLAEIPTGHGTTAEWLFEPQIGTNHWGVGLGMESMVVTENELKFLLGANYRYLVCAWETRSFDLIGNGAWSRYLSVQNMYGLPTAPATPGLQGINFLTQQAQIQGRSQVNAYARLEKTAAHCAFELSYNFFYNQQETIGKIENIVPGYGVYALTGSAGGSGGVTTASTATISQALPTLDPIFKPVALTTEMFDKTSAQMGTVMVNTLAVRIQRMEESFNYGLGGSVDLSPYASVSGISTWAVWLKFEYLFKN